MRPCNHRLRISSPASSLHGILWGFRLVGMSDLVLERTVAESQSERSEIVLPADSNALGSLFGGRLMQYIDLVGAMAASATCTSVYGDGEHGSSGFCGSCASRGVADFEGECEPCVSDLHGNWCTGDGGGRAGATVAPCFFGVSDVCRSGSRGESTGCSAGCSGDRAPEASI